MQSKRKIVWVISLVLLGGGIFYGVAGWFIRSASVQTLSEAGRYLARNETKTARECLRWLLWFEPDNTEALLLVGISHHVEKRFPEAIRILERIPADSNEFEGASLTLARSLLLELELDRAELVLKACLNRFPRSDPVREELLQIYMKQMRRREAISLLYGRWRQYPHDLEVLSSLARVMVEPVSPQDRITYFTKANVAKPNQGTVVLALARIFAMMGQPEQADQFFRVSLELRPKHLLTHILAAEFFWVNGDRKSVRRILRMMSNTRYSQGTARSDDRYWAMVAKVRKADGELEDAYEAIQKALEIRSNSYALMSWKCGLLRTMNRHDEAEELAANASRISDAESQLFVQVHESDLTSPTVQECSELARLLEVLGYLDQAAGWRTVRGLVDG